MKLRVPDHIGGLFSHKGRLLEPDAESCVEVADQEAEALLSHGFQPLRPADAASSLDELTREQLVARVMEMTAATLASLSTEELRARLRASSPTQTLPPDESRGAGVASDPAQVGADDIERMSRVELFAFLRARGVATALPIRNDELRARARAALPAAAETD